MAGLSLISSLFKKKKKKNPILFQTKVMAQEESLELERLSKKELQAAFNSQTDLADMRENIIQQLNGAFGRLTESLPDCGTAVENERLR